MYSTPNQQKRPLDFGGSQQSWSNSGSAGDGGSDRKKKRRSRWGAEDVQDKTVIPGMPTIIPANLSKEQEQQYLLHLQIEEISRRLRTGDLGIPPNPEDRFAARLIHEITTLLFSEQELVPVIYTGSGTLGFFRPFFPIRYNKKNV